MLNQLDHGHLYLKWLHTGHITKSDSAMHMGVFIVVPVTFLC